MHEFTGKQVLVTGGAGFIGSHLVDKLVDLNAKVTVVDNLITGNKKNLDRVMDQIEFLEEEVGEWAREQVRKAKSEKRENFASFVSHNSFHYIFHLASPASPRGYMEKPEETYMVNSLGTHYLTKMALGMRARLLFASTSESYGDPLEHPQKETYFGNVNPVGPRACYDESKRFGEMVMMNAIRNLNLDGSIVRIFNTYGPRMDPKDGRIFPQFINQALKNEPITVYGDGSQTRSFCYVTDLVEMLMRAMLEPKALGEVINIGNPEEYSVLTMAEKIKTMTASLSEITFLDKPTDDPNRRQPDITKAKTLLGYEPQVALEEGLSKTIEYFKLMRNE